MEKKRKAVERKVFFVSPDEFSRQTNIQLTIQKKITNYYQDNDSHEKITDIVLLNRNDEDTIFCLPMEYEYISVTLNGDDLYVIDIRNNKFTKAFQKEVTTSWRQDQKLYTILNIDVEKLLSTKPIPIPEAVQREIDRINTLIRCRDYRVAFNYGYNFHEGPVIINNFSMSPCKLMICFFRKNTCLSSVEIVPELPNAVWINSYSNPQVERSKVNQLLRAVAVLILPKLNPSIEFMKSYAVNAISSYILINKLNGYQDEMSILNESSVDLSRRPLPFHAFAGAMDIIVNVQDRVTIDAANQLIEEVIHSAPFRWLCDEEEESEDDDGGEWNEEGSEKRRDTKGGHSRRRPRKTTRKSRKKKKKKAQRSKRRRQ